MESSPSLSLWEKASRLLKRVAGLMAKVGDPQNSGYITVTLLSLDPVEAKPSRGLRSRSYSGSSFANHKGRGQA